MSGRNVTYRGGSTPTGEGRASECKLEQTDKTGQTSDRLFSLVQRVNSFEFRSHPLLKSFALQLVVRSSSFLVLLWERDRAFDDDTIGITGWGWEQTP